jgi:hypothetical protein
MSGLAKAIEQFDGVALEITQQANVDGQIEHGSESGFRSANRLTLLSKLFD